MSILESVESKINIRESPKVNLIKWRTRWTVIGAEFMVLFLFWVLLSGRYEIKYLAIGLAAAAIVTYFTNDLLYNPLSIKENGLDTKYIFVSVWRLLNYIPWLVWAIIKANIQVAIIILKPRMPIDPCMMKLKTQLRRKTSLVTLANSITLTPGTITVELKNNTFIIHSLIRDCASDIETGIMQNKAGQIFGENNDCPPDFSWSYSNPDQERR